MTVTHRHRIDKALFAAGQQCAKRLFLEYHHPKEVPEAPLTRQQLVAVGSQLLELAYQGFPKGTLIDDEDARKAARQTEAVLERKDGAALFNSCFIHEQVEVRCDIVLPSKGNRLDLFEVKSGTKIKQRHIIDVALQIYVLERLGYEVGSASILHLDPDYVHTGGREYPAHKIFRNIEVTKKARKRVRHIRELLDNYQTLLDDASTADLPTGTWCLAPIPCVFLPRCRSQAEGRPLIDLPDLNRQQEFELHQAGIENLAQVDIHRHGLSLAQRRALRAIHSDTLIVEADVKEELCDIDQPLAVVSVEFCLQVMPIFANSRPWQHLPVLWHGRRRNPKGADDEGSWQSDGKSDPRIEFVTTLHDWVQTSGTLLLHNSRLDSVLGQIAADLPEVAAQANALLDHPAIEISEVLRSGVYGPGFPADYDFDTIATQLVPGHKLDDLDLKSAQDIAQAYQKLLSSRTRSATREKIVEQFDQLGRRRVEGLLGIYTALTQ